MSRTSNQHTRKTPQNLHPLQPIYKKAHITLIMSSTRKVFIIGGTGAQGLPIIEALARDGAYSVRILTRDTSSRRAQSLLSTYPGRVELVPGTFTSESDVRAGMAGCWGAFVNIDGFAVGEALEIFYTMRCYELAIQTGVKMYVHGNIDFGCKR